MNSVRVYKWLAYSHLLLLLLLLARLVDSQTTSYHERCYPLQNGRQQRCYKTLGRIIDPTMSRLKSLDSATLWCTQLGKDYSLATVPDAEAQRCLTSFLTDFELTSDDVWLSLRRTTMNKWTNVDGTDFDGATSISAPTENMTSVYLHINSSGASPVINIGADVSRDIKKYICQFTGQRCRDFNQTNVGVWLDQNGTGNCYVVYPRDNERATQPWYMARQQCLHLDGDLASYNVSKVAPSTWFESGQKYWIGVQRDALMWVDPDGSASPVKYTNFIRGEPTAYNVNTTCVSLSFASQWTWAVRSCSDAVLFVCHNVTAIDGNNASILSSVSPSHVAPTVFHQPECDNTNNLSGGAIGGIAAGCCAFYIISVVVAFLIGCFCCQRSQRPAGNEQLPIDAFGNPREDREPPDGYVVPIPYGQESGEQDEEKPYMNDEKLVRGRETANSQRIYDDVAPQLAQNRYRTE